ncbi:metal-dependent hydrolase [Photobacterium pectinilyticum]|uniref:metal-dependent hydrolase n=1 Tax=Photobacterium pectinilyticum TaxID=2906793 RepID=UPI0035A132B9
MNLHGHLAIASLGYVMLEYAVPWLPMYQLSPLLALPLVLLGALLCDVDHPESTIGRLCLFISWPIRIIFGHRGITHSLLAILCLWYFLGSNPYACAIIIGASTHLLGDFLTPSGIPLLYPYRKRYRLALITNPFSEFIVSASAIVVSYLYW